MNELKVILGEELFEFSDEQEWINTANMQYSRHEEHKDNTIAIDAEGRVCKRGPQFIRARVEKAYPIKVFVQVV
ncbi:MAG: hypothetical protein QM500_19580 [Methylococcales bacterium]